MGTKLGRHLKATTGVCGGKPRIADTRITIKDIVLMHLKLGHPLAQIAGTYDLPLGALHEAMAYYYDHQAEMDRMIVEDDAFVEVQQGKTPSLLQQKLRSMRVA